MLIGRARTVDLGYILHSLDEKISLDETDHIEKTVYLLQSFGIYLGYAFSWYFKGPYCTKVLADSYGLQEVYDTISQDADPIDFETRECRKKFEAFKSFYHKMGRENIGIAASIHYLHKATSMDSDKIMAKVAAESGKSADECEKIWENAEKNGLLMPERGSEDLHALASLSSASDKLDQLSSIQGYQDMALVTILNKLVSDMRAIECVNTPIFEKRQSTRSQDRLSPSKVRSQLILKAAN